MNIKYCYLLLFNIVTLQLFSQTLTGVVQNEFGEKIISGYVVQYKDSISRSVVGYTLIRDGIFMLELTNTEKNQTISLEIFSKNYQSQRKKIEFPSSENLIVELVKDDKNFLSEVLVRNESIFKVKKDTISFKVSAYKALEDRKVEDVIKRLPGISVDEQSGVIYYNGISIENITLDGDDLFRYNYTIASKNINLSIIDEIEVVENYSRNKLLKGIENSDKISVNLKLKKNVTDINGSLETNQGLFDDFSLAYANNLNVMTLNSRFKSFANFSLNNVGVDNSPFSIHNSASIEDINEKNKSFDPVIIEPGFSSFIENERANLNDHVFSSFNSLFKINKKFSINTSLYFSKDEMNNTQVLRNQIEVNNEEFFTLDEINFTNKPTFRRIDQEYNYELNNSSNLQYIYRIQQNVFSSNNSIVQNQEQEFNSNQQTENIYIKQSLFYTLRLDTISALKFNANYFYNNNKQRLDLLSFNDDMDLLDSDQNLFRKNHFIDIETDYLRKIGKDNFSFKFFSSLDNNNFNSLLEKNDGMGIQIENDFIFNKFSLGVFPSYKIVFDKTEITTSVNLSYMKLNYEATINDLTLGNQNILLQPSLRLTHQLSNKSSLIATVSHKRVSVPINYLFLNPILIDNRTTITNIPSLDFIKSNVANLLYSYNDLFNNFQVTSNINYNVQTGNFLSILDIDQNTIELIYFFEPVAFSSLNFSTQISKFVPTINSTIKYRLGFTTNSFQNRINNSEIRNNTVASLSNQFFYKSAFSFFLNVENEATYFTNLSSSSLGPTLVNNSFVNKFKIFSKFSKNYRATLTMDLYVPNVNDLNEHFDFWDFDFLVKSSNQKWEYGVRLKNIFNTNNFVQIQNNDFSTSVFASNILPMHSLFFINFDF
jgi:hypothetical protein